MLSAWKRSPVILKAILTGALVAVVGTVTWALLVKINLAVSPGIPWSILPAGILLWLYWKYLRGDGWPASTSTMRKNYLRATSIPGDEWVAAIIAGIIGLVSVLLFMRVMNRIIELPHQQLTASQSIPKTTLFLLLLMGSIVAGVVEEAAFRGYMQGPIEKRHGPVLALLITGILFSLAHFTHPETSFSLMPFYFGVAVVYGMMAYLTNSILPAMVLHAIGDIFGGLDLVTRGQSEWQTPAKPESLIWGHGTDYSFWLSCILFLFSFIGAVLAFRWLSTVVKSINVGQQEDE